MVQYTSGNANELRKEAFQNILCYGSMVEKQRILLTISYFKTFYVMVQ